MGKNKSGWRDQAVYVERDINENEKTSEFSICEVYLDKNGKLEMWTESREMSPYGNTIEELISDVQFMLDDVSRWKPVPFDSLKIGMRFERAE